MNRAAYQAIGPERPFGDREGSDEQWTPERIEEISNEEVKTPETGNDVDEPAPDDPITPRERQEHGNRAPHDEPGFGQGA
jgi:hypothetical protein